MYYIIDKYCKAMTDVHDGCTTHPTMMRMHMCIQIALLRPRCPTFHIQVWPHIYNNSYARVHVHSGQAEALFLRKIRAVNLAREEQLISQEKWCGTKWMGLFEPHEPPPPPAYGPAFS